MNIKESPKVRIISSVWLISLALLSTFWWAVCIIEWLSKMKHRKLISSMDKEVKTGYFDILFDAYRAILKDTKTTIKEIKSGRRLWR